MKDTTKHSPCEEGTNMLRLHWKTALAAALCAAACSRLGLAQVAPPSILRIDVANNVLYQEDASDVSKFCDGSQRYQRLARREKLQPGRRRRRHCGHQWPARDGDSYSLGGERFSQHRPRPRPGNR